MRKNEVRALARASALLLAVSGVRAVLSAVDRPAEDPPEASVVDALLASSEDAAAENAARSEPVGPGERIDPNSASEADLDRLPGIGPALARRIVAGRVEGPFLSPADLERVAGIGPKTLDRLRDKLEFPGAGPGVDRRRRAPSESAPRALDLARMSPDQLQELDGIGPALAGRIVDFRRGRAGPLEPDELLEVPGIGPATLERIKRSLHRMPARR